MRSVKPKLSHAIQLAKPLLSAIVGVSHLILSPRVVVRDGTGATTLVPSRLYHVPC
jgi:hypothetical protein